MQRQQQDDKSRRDFWQITRSIDRSIARVAMSIEHGICMHEWNWSIYWSIEWSSRKLSSIQKRHYFGHNLSYSQIHDIFSRVSSSFLSKRYLRYFILMTHGGSHREVQQDFQTQLTSQPRFDVRINTTAKQYHSEINMTSKWYCFAVSLVSELIRLHFDLKSAYSILFYFQLF